MSLQEFQIIKELGSGSFGSVFKVKKRSDQKVYAMKQVKLTKLNAKQRQNALNQVRLLASIRTPYIISYKDAFFDQYMNLLCIVMEFADGGDLQKLIENHKKNMNRFDQNYIWKTAFDLLIGIKKLHENKILHRDIKAANIFFVDGIAKLGDLNVSRVIGNQGFAQTQTGTPYYTSPQIWNNQPYGPKCDIWSIGCVLYQMATFYPPFRANDFAGLYRKVKQGIYQKIPSQYSGHLVNLIDKCLQTNPKKRANSFELLQLPNFQKFIQNNIYQDSNSSIDLIQTIRVPRVLKQLNSKLPGSHYEQKRKVAFFQQGDDNYQQKQCLKNVSILPRENPSNYPKSLRHIKSQKCIQINRQDNPNVQNKIQGQINLSNKKNHHNPQCYIQPMKGLEELRLPKLQSAKNILQIEGPSVKKRMMY